MFETVVVANRGEIATRIIRTLHALGIRAVAVYSDADRDARHVREADEAWRLGPAPASESYLHLERVVEAAIASGADALHPGYGFLSENASLARACAEAGIAFVGPPPVAIEAMGDKIRAKQAVAARGVPVVPGVSGAGLGDAELVEAATTTIGFPMLLKPSAGGGGKGMRLVTDVSALPEAIAAAKREALGAFGDDTLLAERFVERPRHIEVQVLADMHGNVVHLGERECSLQRRHQKVVEEAPSPLLSPDQRAALGAQAVAAARACDYANAGTVEFIVSGDRPDEPFFLEMNTRLQVEHPVTEMVWGVDLVELQLRIAAGEPLPFGQDELRPSGWAIEARVYAEDPSRSFLPTGGTVLRLREPTGLPGVRVDSSLVEGAEIGSAYDPMLSKVVAWGPDRDTARRRLRRALAATSVLGVTTNVGFLRGLLALPDVVAGVLDTALVERITPSSGPAVPPRAACIVAALLMHVRGPHETTGPWDDRTGWRAGGGAWATWTADVAGEVVSVRHRVVDGRVEVALGDDEPTVAAVIVDGDAARLELDGRSTRFTFAPHGRSMWVGCDGEAWPFAEPEPLARHGSEAGAQGAAIVCPMPGTVVALSAAVGDELAAGQAVVVVEAMKMEHALCAGSDGVLIELLVALGDRVALNEHIATVGST